jgi:hypothetical protein
VRVVDDSRLASIVSIPSGLVQKLYDR